MSDRELRRFSSELENAENTARIRLFGKAARIYGKLAERAQYLHPESIWEMRFLSLLYTLNEDIAERRDPHKTGSLRHLLSISSEMPEQTMTMTLLGGVFGEFSSDRIFTELSAIQLLYEGMVKRRADVVRQAVDSFLRIDDEHLFYSRYLIPLERRITGNRAALECEARAQILEGEDIADPEPSSAVAHFMIAVRALRSAKLYAEEAKFKQVLSGLRVVRTCWFCGRRIQGSQHLVWLNSTVSPYFTRLLENNKEDLRIIQGNQLVSCQPCYSAINKEAERIARGYYEQLQAQLQKLAQRVSNIERRV